MGGRSKRKFDEFDPNKSDPNDEDYDNRVATTPVRSTRKKVRSAGKPTPSAKRRPAKRSGREYDDSDDAIVDDSDDISEDSSSAEEEEEDDGPVSAKTGRRARKAVQNRKVTYTEASDEEIEDDLGLDEQTEEEETHLPAPSRRIKSESVAPQRPSLIVKLKLSGGTNNNARTTRSRTGSKANTRAFTPAAEETAFGTRRSSRISQDPQPDLLALTDSGRHAQVARRGTATPEPRPQPQSRQNWASKGVKKHPSTIIEVSQEEVPATQESTDIMSQLHEHAGLDEAPMVEDGVAESPFIPDAPPEDGGHDDIIMDHGEYEGGKDAVAENADGDDDDDDDDDDGPILRRASRTLRSQPEHESPPSAEESKPRRTLRPRKAANEQSSDFEPEAENAADDNISSEDELHPSQNRRTRKSDNDSSSNAGGRRSTRIATKRTRSSRSRHSSDGASELDPDEIADEAAELDADRRRNKRPRRARGGDQGITFEPTTLRNRSTRPDYRVFRPELVQQDDEEVLAPAPSSQRNRRGAAGPWRSLFSTLGPFGGAGGPTPIFGGPEGTGAAGGADSDSSDDDMAPRAHGMGGTVGMTPTSGAAPLLPQTHNADPSQGGGGPANFGKVKDRKALADADPLGVDPTVSFEGVGGLDDHIDRLKEMVALPLLYPEVFQQFHITPPRGVLFHGPPGTGKTLLARALASSVSTQGQKVTFYMRKGADALSKWVGEAERQLRLLFEEARKNQPSIIFFDEIDGLAPVRSSKQEQIHASIVATLLALMDGMDGRGQVIVIGATNRPDSVDPALRRPGRFDREFYFPLPSQPARRQIIDIHTKGWDPPLQPEFKDQLASLTKGYGGADLRALCTEAALNAVQGTFPQIYQSTKKLLIDPTKIRVLAKDFMISVNKIVPSSERSASSGSAPLKKSIEPLLRDSLANVSKLLDEIIPQKKKATALEEAMFDDRDDENGFEKENMQRDFETSRIFRPRLLIRGLQGMGQQYISAALLSKFEGLHVQSFDLPTLMKDATRSTEAAVVQLFEEVKRHKPSVIYIPDVETWYHTLSDSTIRTFTGLLRSLSPTDPVLLLGVLEQTSPNELDASMMKDLFGYSSKSSYILDRPSEPGRREFFTPLIQYVKQSPMDFPDPANRKKRVLEELPEAPVIEEQRGPTKAEIKAQKKHDRHTLNMLKLHIQQVMDQIKLKYKKFRNPVIDDSQISYLYEEQDPSVVSTDLTHEQAQEMQDRPFKIEKDERGVDGLREAATGKFYYNLEIVTIEKRLSNGYYKRPKDFLADIKRLAKDARNIGDQERTLKANEMLANVEVDMINLEKSQPALIAECEAVFDREQAREAERLRNAEVERQEGKEVPTIIPNVPPYMSNGTTEQSAGPVILGENVPGQRIFPPYTPSRLPGPSPLSNGFTDNGSHRQSNGSTLPSGDQEDSEMTDSHHDHSEMSNLMPQGAHIFATHRSANTQHTPTHTQMSAITRIAPGTSRMDYYNSASTTTSGNKTSDRSSGGNYYNPPHGSNESNASSNGVRIRNSGDIPDFAADAPSGGSQLMDTQPGDTSSQFSNPQSSPQHAMGPPTARPLSQQQQIRHPTSVMSLLNDPVDEEKNRTLHPLSLPAEAEERNSSSMLAATSRPQQALPLPQLNVIPVEPPVLQTLHDGLVRKSSGLSVEQLEQVMASLMDAVWRTRGDANRNHAAKAVEVAFNEIVADIEQYQYTQNFSQETRCQSDQRDEGTEKRD